MPFGKGLLIFLIGAGFMIFSIFGSATICMTIASIGSISFASAFKMFDPVISQFNIILRILIYIPMVIAGAVLWIVMTIFGSIFAAILCPIIAGTLGFFIGIILMIVGFFKMF